MQNSEIGVHQKISQVDEQSGDNVRIWIENLLKQLSLVNAQCNIFRVPEQLRKVNPSAYDPQMITIGPFHHLGRKDLEFREQYKVHGLMNFLHRMNDKLESSEEDSLITKSSEDVVKTESLNVLVTKAHTWAKEARKCYGEPINMEDEDFVKMILVDGCFLVDIFILDYELNGLKGFPPTQTKVNHSFYGVRIDLTKLENQVPFFVLKNLFDLIPKHDKSISFEILTYKFFRLRWLQNYEFSNEILSAKLPKHFVDFLSFYFDPNMPPDIQKKHDENSKKKNSSLGFIGLPLHSHRQKLLEKIGNEMNKLLTFFSCCHRQKQCEDINEEEELILPSITELFEAGVTIKKAKNAKSMMNISFKNGVLEIPPLDIDDSFETIMRNLIAFEQVHTDNTIIYVTQYALFMDDLISTKKDVNLLVKAGILKNNIGGNHKEILELFNNLCKFVTTPVDNYYDNISKDLCEHCRGCWNKSKVSFKQKYCNTPWAFISILAASFLLVLTLLQTIFTGISTF